MDTWPAGVDTCEVLVVGAGPTGLLLANQLGQRGISCVVVERLLVPPHHSMAIGITPPSLDIFRQLDLDQTLIGRGVPVSRFHVYEDRRLLGSLNFEDIPSRYPFILSLPQSRVIDVLEQSLGRWPQVRLCRGAELAALDEAGDRVIATVQSADGPKRIAGSYLVGCDGHRSRVRDLAAIPCAVQRYRPHFVMADYEDRTDLGPEAHLFLGRRGSVESFPLPGRLRRWIVLAPPEPRGRDEGAVVCRHVMSQTGYDLSRQEALAHSAFTPKWLLCRSFHRGRVVLGGDAAHVMSPIGGQGMNTGFADVELLAVVLQQILRHAAPPQRLFDTYTRLRCRVFRMAAARSARGMWLGTRTGRWASQARSWFIRGILLQPPVKQRLPPYFAMLTIPRPGLPRPPQRALSLDRQLQDPALKQAYNQRLFAEVADRYGFATRALSLGRDGVWKRLLVAALPALDRPVCLDVACGTGDITALLAARYPAARVYGIDLAPAMLARARRRGIPGAVFSRQDMCRLALPPASIDIVTGGYALRNSPSLPAALAETARVLRPGGTAAFLEFSKPAGRMPQVLEYGLLKLWGSLWGYLLHGKPQTYAYIAESLRFYPDRAALHRLTHAAGFDVLHSRVFYFGLVELLVLRKR